MCTFMHIDSDEFLGWEILQGFCVMGYKLELLMLND
jgi:hypothetical protein